MSQTSQVNTIIKALSGLENDIDALNEKVADMKKQLNSTAIKEIETLNEKTVQIATSEAESIISEARSSAESQSQQIAQDGEAKLAQIQSQIDANFDAAVNDVVSSVLKA